MARILFANNASDTLNGAINGSVTTITLNDASEFYSPSGDEIAYATIDDGTNVEIITYTGVSTNNLTGVTRGVDGTSGTSFADAVTVEQRNVAAAMNTYTQGPASSTDNAIPRYDSTTGRLLQNSGVTISDTDAMAGVAGLDLDASTNLSFNSVNILADSSGTMTLSNIDAIDATTEATFKADFLANDGGTGTGVYDFGGADSFEIPNSAAPTVNADGEIAFDTTVTDFSTGLIRFYGNEEQGIVSMPIAQFTSPTDGYVVSYNATNDEFELVEAAGGGTPGGSDTQVQYNNSGSFGGITGATTNGTTLTLVAPVLGTPASGNGTNLVMPSCQVTNTTAQTIANATVTTLTWDTETWDNDTIHDTGTNTSRLTATTAGVYLCAVGGSWASNDTGVRKFFLYKNGAQVAQTSFSASVVTGSDDAFLYYVVSLNATDYMEIKCNQNSGGNLNIGPNSTFFSMTKIGKLS